MKSYTRHLLICTGSDCKSGEKAIKTALKKTLSRHNRTHKNLSVMFTKTKCFGECKKGPIMVVYPDGIWYHNVDAKAIQRIVDEHFMGGKPVEKYIFHRLENQAATTS